jgi:hypothetical protein
VRSTRFYLIRSQLNSGVRPIQTSMNRKKLVERERLDSFLRCTGRSNFPNPEEGESPDFVFRLGDQRIGVEVTGMVSHRLPGGDNPRQSSRTLERLTDVIRDRYDKMGGPRIHLSIFPGDRPRISGTELGQLAETLAAEILEGIDRAIGQQDSRQPWRIWIQHPSVRSVAAWYCAPYEKSRWHVHRGGMVDSARAEDILATLRGKEPKLAQYRARASEVWLLIVCDLFSDGLFIDPPAEPVTFAVRTGFDRIFCLEWTGSRAVEVPGITHQPPA